MTNQNTFTERTAALMRLSAFGLVPKQWKELMQDMAGALDASAIKISNLENRLKIAEDDD
jgi:hypothetical protein